MMDEDEIANWKFGRLEVFFEGSWSQVCANHFDGADANVACRQLGYGAGTSVPQILTAAKREDLQQTLVFPEVAIVGSVCNGDEERLVNCGASVRGPEDPPGSFFGTYQVGLTCRNKNGAGLFLACVASPLSEAESGEHRLKTGTVLM